MRSFHDIGIDFPPGSTGEIRTTCRKCSRGRGKNLDNSLSVNIQKGVWHCWYCDWRGCLYGTHHSTKIPFRLSPVSSFNPNNAAKIHRIWRQAYGITTDDPVAHYLRQRGLGQSNIPADLRYHPRLRYLDGKNGLVMYYPAMLAAVRDREGRLVNVHRTYLTHDGHKANVPSPKKLMPSPTKGATCGAAVRLDPPENTMAVTEGIETGLAVRLCTGLPTWATIGTSGMRSLAMPDMVRTVIICADHDRHGEGFKAAKVLARRMLAEQRIVKILMPETPGTDWADAMEVGGAEQAYP